MQNELNGTLEDKPLQGDFFWQGGESEEGGRESKEGWAAEK